MTFLVFGYDTEEYGGHAHSEEEAQSIRNDTINIVTQLVKLHDGFKNKATFFVLGKFLEREPRLSVLGNMDIQSHLYSHSLVKRIPGLERPLLTLQQLDDDIHASKKLFQEKFSYTPKGIRFPYGYFEGMQNNQAILDILKKHSIQFISSDLRDRLHTNRVPWKRFGKYLQPYQYSNGIIEIPCQGTMDTEFLPSTKTNEQIVAYYMNQLRFAEKNNIIYCPCFHPWCLGKIDPDLNIIQSLLSYAKENHIKVLTYTQLTEVVSHGLPVL